MGETADNCLSYLLLPQTHWKMWQLLANVKNWMSPEVTFPTHLYALSHHPACFKILTAPCRQWPEFQLHTWHYPLTPPKSIIDWVTKGPRLTLLHTLFLSQQSAAFHVKLVLAVILHLFEITFHHKDCLLINHLDKHRLWLTWKIQCTHSSLVLAFEQWQTFQGLGVPNMDSSISSNLNQKVNWNLCPQKFKAHQ